LLEELGIENGWIQEMSAPENYRPDFGGKVILLSECMPRTTEQPMMLASTGCIDEDWTLLV